MKNKTIILYPFLFAIYPVVFLFAHNIEEVPITHFFLPLTAAFLMSVLLWFLLGFYIKDKIKRALALFFFFFIFYTYSYFYDFLYNLGLGLNILTIKHYYLILFLLILWAGLTYLIKKSTGKFHFTTKLLNIAAIFLIGYNFAAILHFEFKNFLLDTSFNKKINKENIRNVDSNTTHLPDIYYIILDEFSNLSTVKKLFHFDHSAFAQNLEKRGFYIAYNSKTRYYRTERSLAASLNMNYLESNSNPFTLISHNRVSAYLYNKGYQIIDFPINAKSKNVLANMNFIYTKEKESFLLNDFYQILLRKTMFRFFFEYMMQKKDFSNIFRKKILNIFEKLETIPGIKGPKFIFAHILCPHEPYVFDRDGNLVDRKHFFNLRDKVYYLDQYIFISKKITQLVDTLLKKSKNAPIIIIQSDHGIRGKIGGKNELEVGDEWKKIFNAYYFPGKDIGVLYDSISPVNSFRLIFNLYFNDNFKLLDD
jgi:hypothetical protein